VLLVLAAGGIGWWMWIHRPTDLELIEELVTKAERGIESKSVKEIMECVAPDYQDNEGLSRNDIWRLAVQWVRSPEKAEITLGNYEIEVRGGEATGKFAVYVLLEEEGGLASGLNFDLVVLFERHRRKLSRVWLVKSVRGYQLEAVLGDYM
jgi:hypothetical protein